MTSRFSEQQIKTAVAAMKAFVEKPYIRYERWERALCLSKTEDPALRELMRHEVEVMQKDDPGFQALMKI
ncbi:MAG: hypothetical protein WCP10_13110 [Desulfuromonadales bacterium]